MNVFFLALPRSAPRVSSDGEYRTLLKHSEPYSAPLTGTGEERRSAWTNNIG